MTLSKTTKRQLAFVAVFILLILIYGFSGGDATAPHKPKLTGSELLAADADLNSYILKSFGGESHNDKQVALVTRVGEAIATRSEAKEVRKPWHFHLLAEPNRINAFAVPTGDVYVTTALVNRMRTEGELAAALSQGVAHILLGHRLDLNNRTGLSYSVAQESAADAKTLKIMADAGYDPQAYLGMFHVLTEAYNTHADTVFFATHPSADGRLVTIQSGIQKLYPTGVPTVLSK